jgi:hypothetical protein
MDGDDDIDLATAALFASKISWWENDGSQNFSEHVVDNINDYPYVTEIVDLDEDSEMDLLGGTVYDYLPWYENDGSENFTKRNLSTARDSIYASSLSAIDMDGDNDLDVLTNDLWHHDVLWYENDGSENFTEHTIDFNFYGCWNLNAADMDHDSDIDVVGAAWRDSAITWWENDGSMVFSRHDISLHFAKARTAMPIDLDGDGDMDIVGTAETADKVSWWESDLGATGIDDDESNLPNNASISSIYPNPFNARTTISLQIPQESDVTLELYDLLGRKIKTLYNGNAAAGKQNIVFDAADLTSNVYFVVMKTDGYFDSRKIVLLK